MSGIFYGGKICAEWLDDGRNMRIMNSISFQDADSGLFWSAPAGSVTDGASIPRFCWTLIGGPFEGKYRRAAVLHDVACQLKDKPSPIVHSMFYSAMRADGVSLHKAFLMYLAVLLFGPRF